MEGNPAEFETIGNRLGHRIVEGSPERLRLVWQGTRFPAFLCLGIALLLLFVSVPIAQAIYLRGFVGPAAALWYFPLMNSILFLIAVYLLSQKRTIIIEGSSKRVTLTRRSFHRTTCLTLDYNEVQQLRLAMDLVYSGFALAGSSAAQSFPVPALRLLVVSGESILLDRGSFRKLKALGERVSAYLEKPLAIADEMHSAV